MLPSRSAFHFEQNQRLLDIAINIVKVIRKIRAKNAYVTVQADRIIGNEAKTATRQPFSDFKSQLPDGNIVNLFIVFKLNNRKVRAV